MSLWNWLTGREPPSPDNVEPYDPEQDKDVQFLREFRDDSNRRTKKLREIREHPSRNAIANSLAKRGEL